MILPSQRVIWEPWLRRATVIPDAPSILHLSLGSPPLAWAAAPLFNAALDIAHRLTQEGVRPGAVCATILRHHWGFYPVYMGIVLAGAVPAVLAYPNPRLHPDKFREGLDGMLAHSGFDWILTEETLLPALGDIVSRAKRDFSGVLFPLSWVGSPGSYGNKVPQAPTIPQADPTDACLLQHSSGTTGLQKPIMLSHLAILEHLRRYGSAIDAQADDVVVSWLPLYHDMGLIAAFHLPLALGIPIVQLDPFEWVQVPATMLRAFSEHKGTVAWLPNFAYNLMADRVSDDDLAGVRLDSVRLLVNCSERVKEESHQRFFARFEAYGLREQVLGASYAMAEGTFAVTQTRSGHRAPVVWVDREALATGQAVVISRESPQAVSCASSGALLADCEIRITDEAGYPKEPGAIGYLLVKSVSLFVGYRNHPEKTREALDNGWYRTGDMGFCIEGEYYVIGRYKDLIIVAGKNIYPEDVEGVVSGVEGVIPGRTVAFGVENPHSGTEEIWVLAETLVTAVQDAKSLRHRILKASLRIDVTIARVVLVPPRWLVKSSSGKLSRHTNRDRIMAMANMAEGAL